MYLSEPSQIEFALNDAMGSNAQLWHFEPTHRKVVLRLAKSDHAVGLHIICVGCRRLTGDVSWKSAQLQVDQKGELLCLVDRSGFELVCEQIFLKKDVGLFDPPI